MNNQFIEHGHDAALKTRRDVNKSHLVEGVLEMKKLLSTFIRPEDSWTNYKISLKI